MQNEVSASPLTLEAADAYCRFLTQRHYENFSVAARFVDGVLRTDLARVYAFCRSTDDLGDESPSGTALPRLDRWRDEVTAMFAGVMPVHPVLFALQQTIQHRRMSAQPFLDLIEANIVDQHVATYTDWPELERYCQLSAAPVGRMVLRVFGIDDPVCERLSDDVCIGLQLANHAQDVGRDAVLGRTYLLQTDVARGGTIAGVRGLVERARRLLESGRQLERRVHARSLRLQLALYRLGGQAICDAIEAIGFQTAAQRPSVSRTQKVSLVVRAALEALRPLDPTRPAATIPQTK